MTDSKGWKEYKRLAEKSYQKKEIPGKATVYRIVPTVAEQKMETLEGSIPPAPLKEKKINVDSLDVTMEVEEKVPEQKEEKQEVKEYKLTRSGMCDRCQKEVKFPSPLCNTKDCKVETINMDSWGQAICGSCEKPMVAVGTTCELCKYYVPAPNETFDAGRVNFAIPLLLQKAEKGTLVTVNQHEMPIPPQTNEDISKDHAINEYVFNHLPLQEDQKEKLMKDLILDQMGKEALQKFETAQGREAKRKEELSSQSSSTKSRKKTKTESSHRKGVKDRC